MAKLRLVAAFLLALPLAIFGAKYFGEFIPMQEDDSSGFDLLMDMRAGGLMLWIALSHLAVAGLLVLPRTRFAGALLQLPLSLGIVAFHGSMMPAGIGPGVIPLVLNLVVLAEPERLRDLVDAD